VASVEGLGHSLRATLVIPIENMWIKQTAKHKCVKHLRSWSEVRELLLKKGNVIAKDVVANENVSSSQ
jgi:gentisate 1,2-dioxygenase